MFGRHRVALERWVCVHGRVVVCGDAMDAWCVDGVMCIGGVCVWVVNISRVVLCKWCVVWVLICVISISVMRAWMFCGVVCVSVCVKVPFFVECSPYGSVVLLDVFTPSVGGRNLVCISLCWFVWMCLGSWASCRFVAVGVGSVSSILPAMIPRSWAVLDLFRSVS